MVSIASLWLPILLSAVLVFIVSAVVHMVLPYHRNDFVKAPTEEAAMNALRGTPPGDYMMPHGEGPAAMKDPAFIERMTRGPIAVVTVLPSGPPSMGKNLVQWFIYTLVVGLVAGYVASRALGPGAQYSEVFRFVGTTAFAGYGLALAQNSIWYGRKWGTTLKSMMDALMFSLLTAGTFGWLWPK